MNINMKQKDIFYTGIQKTSGDTHMAHTSDPSSFTNRPDSSSNDRSRLNGASLSRSALLLASLGTIGGILFTATYTIEGLTRSGYNTLAQPVSSLSLGPGGWVQQVNFIIFGVLVLIGAVGWRQVLKPGAGAVWFPILEAVTGLGLIADGIFSQDPKHGYPVGAILTAPTLHGNIHLAFAFVTITAVAFSCFVLARRFAVEPGWRGWVTYSVITGLLTIILIALYGIEIAQNGPIAGILERLATGVHSIWGILLLGRLWLETRHRIHMVK